MVCDVLFKNYSVAALQDELHIQSHVRPLTAGRNVFPVQGNVYAAISVPTTSSFLLCAVLMGWI